jgi:hypothetical protein
METNPIYLTFHIGRGGKFFNAGHLTFIGAYDFQWVIDHAVNDGKVLLEGNRIETETGRVLLDGEDAVNAKTGVLDFDGEYDTDYTTTADDLTEREKEAVRRAFCERVGVSSFEELSLDMSDYLTEYEGIDEYESEDGRFVLYPSNEKQGHWVCADKFQGIVCVFREHHFNDEQKVSSLFNSTDAWKLPTYLREMGDWLADNHYNKVV